MPGRRRRDHHATGVRKGRIFEMDPRQAREELLGTKHRVPRVCAESSPERSVGSDRRDRGTMTQVKREGLSKGQVARARTGEVAVVHDQVGGARLLHPGGQVGTVALRKRGRGVDPGAGGGPETHRMQHLVAPRDLRSDFAGDTRFGQGSEINRDVGLVENLLAVEGAHLREGMDPLFGLREAGRPNARRIHGERCRNVWVTGQRRPDDSGRRAVRDGQDEADAELSASADGTRQPSLLIRKEGREAGNRRRRVLSNEGHRDGIDIAALTAQRRAPEVKRLAPGSAHANTAGRRSLLIAAQHRDADGRRRTLTSARDRKVGLA